MRAIGLMARRSRTPVLGGLLLGAALWTGLGPSPAAAQNRASDQTATRELGLAIARPDTMPGLQTPLAPSEAARLRRIFDLQARGEHDLAGRETERLEDRRLLGHVLADRWLRDAGRARADDLQAWLAAHGDHPDAPEIHALLVRACRAAPPCRPRRRPRTR
jgi:hypothetical protein